MPNASAGAAMSHETHKRVIVEQWDWFARDYC
jgi:hypothetical protein